MADCEARCVDGDDVGMPEYAASLVNLDYECQVHNRHDWRGSEPWDRVSTNECEECGIAYREHVCHHGFIPAGDMDAHGMLTCGQCGVPFDKHT